MGLLVINLKVLCLDVRRSCSRSPTSTSFSGIAQIWERFGAAEIRTDERISLLFRSIFTILWKPQASCLTGNDRSGFMGTRLTLRTRCNYGRYRKKIVRFVDCDGNTVKEWKRPV